MINKPEQRDDPRNSACKALADQARREFGEIKIHRMENKVTGQVWGKSVGGAWVDTGLVVRAEEWNEKAIRRNRR